VRIALALLLISPCRPDGGDAVAVHESRWAWGDAIEMLDAVVVVLGRGGVLAFVVEAWIQQPEVSPLSAARNLAPRHRHRTPCWYRVSVMRRAR
jgi:hypothetical protein